MVLSLTHMIWSSGKSPYLETDTIKMKSYIYNNSQIHITIMILKTNIVGITFFPPYEEENIDNRIKSMKKLFSCHL